jgi:hypothetical protein
MKDYLAQVEKLRKDAAECALIRDQTTDKSKWEMFERLAVPSEQPCGSVEMEVLKRKSENDR